MPQKEGGVQTKTQNLSHVKLGHEGGGQVSQTLICPNFKSVSRTKYDVWRVVPLYAIRGCYPSIMGTNQKVKSFAIQPKKN